MNEFSARDIEIIRNALELRDRVLVEKAGEARRHGVDDAAEAYWAEALETSDLLALLPMPETADEPVAKVEVAE